MEAGMNKIKVGNLKSDIYIPENCNENTKFIVYYNGDGTAFQDKKVVINELNKNGSDAIVLFSSIGNYDDVTETISQVAQEYNIKDLNVTPIGYSIGSYFSSNEMIDVIEKNPDISPQILVHLDGYAVRLPDVFKKNTQTLLDNNSVVMTLYRKGNNYKHLNDYKELAASGVNVLFLQYKNEDAKSHGHVNDEFFINGNLNFLTGTGELNDMYSVSVYDKQTGDLKEIDYNDINELYKVYDYFGIDTYSLAIKKINSLSAISLQNLSIKSDSAILSQPLNQIIGGIKNTSYIKNNFTCDGSFSSTTSMPSQVPQVAKDFFVATANLLVKIANDVQEFAKIGPLIDKMDRDLANQAIQQLELKNSQQITTQTTLNATTSKETTSSNQTKVEEKSTILANETILANAVTTIGSLVANTKNQNQSSNTIVDNTKNTTSNIKNEEIKTPEETELSKETINSTTTSSSSKSSSNYYSNTSKKQISSNTEINLVKDFPKYEEIYSDETKMVYNYNDKYKIIVHKNGDKITGIEHYYDFGTENDATTALQTLKTEYTNNEHTKNIMQKGRYVKVIFDKDMYSNLTINEIRNKYSDLSEIVKI